MYLGKQKPKKTSKLRKNLIILWCLIHACCKCKKTIVFPAAVFGVRLFQKGVQFAWAKQQEAIFAKVDSMLGVDPEWFDVFLFSPP